MIAGASISCSDRARIAGFPHAIDTCLRFGRLTGASGRAQALLLPPRMRSASRFMGTRRISSPRIAAIGALSRTRERWPLGAAAYSSLGGFMRGLTRRLGAGRRTKLSRKLSEGGAERQADVASSKKQKCSNRRQWGPAATSGGCAG